MAIQSGIPVSFDAYFPRGAFMLGEVEEVVKWSDDGQRQGQDLDKVSGKPIWQVRVIDADPEARKGQNEITVKIVSVTRPIEPPEMSGMPFRPVVFEGMTVIPYVKEGSGRPRVAFSIRAADMKPAGKPRGGE